MKYAVLFSLAAAAAVFAALQRGGVWWLMAYPAVSFACVAVAYAFDDPAVFGKRRDGTIAWTRRVVLAPYHFLLHATWHAARLVDRRPPVERLTPDLYLSRRPTAAELPPDVAGVLDLTCEFAEAEPVRTRGVYQSEPLLDGVTPESSRLRNVAAAASSMPRPLLIHCAQGRGRTALVAAALLLRDGVAADVDEAIDRVREARPTVHFRGAYSNVLRALQADRNDDAD